MSRRGISKLPLPPRLYRVDLTDEGDRGKSSFETRELGISEDRTRARLLRETARDVGSFADPDDAENLARRLDRGVRENRLPRSPASFRYMRKHRIRIIGWLWRLYDRMLPIPVTMATLLPRKWEISADDLHLVEPKKLLNSLRGDLNRVGAKQARGWLFAGLHGEYDQTTNRFLVHVHMIVAGEMIGVVDRLRYTPKYRARSQSSNCENRERAAVRIERKTLENIPAPLTYCLQSFWPKKYFNSGEAGDPKRADRARIPEPYHSHYLLWLDRWRLEDITLLIGLRVIKSRLKIAKGKKYTKARKR